MVMCVLDVCCVWMNEVILRRLTIGNLDVVEFMLLYLVKFDEIKIVIDFFSVLGWM